MFILLLLLGVVYLAAVRFALWRQPAAVKRGGLLAVVLAYLGWVVFLGYFVEALAEEVAGARFDRAVGLTAVGSLVFWIAAPWIGVTFGRPCPRSTAARFTRRVLPGMLVAFFAALAVIAVVTARRSSSRGGSASRPAPQTAPAAAASAVQDTEQLYEAADSEGQEWREFVGAWWETHHDRWVATTDLLTLALKRDLLGAAIGDKSPRSQKIRMGKALSAARDRHFASWRVVAGRNLNTKAAQYRLIECDTDTADLPPPGQLELGGGSDAGCCGMTELPYPQHIPQGKLS